MDILGIVSLLQSKSQNFDIYERKPGKYQLIVPIRHEDGDMVDIYLQESPRGEDYLRICDFGMALMRLSYSYDINSETRESIFNSILANNGVMAHEGNLYLDAKLNILYESILQFAGCSQKVCNMRYWSKERIRTNFYEDLKEYITSELRAYNPQPDKEPISGYDIISVDWSMNYNNRNFYLFGVHNNDKAKSAAISLLELQMAGLPFMSLVVHEEMEGLGGKERTYLTKNADKQYPTLDDFREKIPRDIPRLSQAA